MLKKIGKKASKCTCVNNFSLGTKINALILDAYISYLHIDELYQYCSLNQNLTNLNLKIN